jgi:ABC-2 type transport system permease protein
MSTLVCTLSDTTTLLRRNLRHMQRYKSLTLMLAGMPVIFLLLFVYVFGGTLGAGLHGIPGLGGLPGGRAGYVDYVVPGMMLFAVAGAVQGTAIAVAMDMAEGIVARFRTMAISRSALLTAHVAGSLIQAALCVAVITGVALLVGYRSGAGPLDWLAAVSVLALFAFALTWLTVALGLAATSVETASNSPMFLMLLPFLGSGFVPIHSMPAGLRQFAEYQPFTPVTETVRGLLMGTPVGNHAFIAVAWCVAIALAGYLWARKLYNRDPVR